MILPSFFIAGAQKSGTTISFILAQSTPGILDRKDESTLQGKAEAGDTVFQ